MESNMANHLTELCRYALKHFLRSFALQLVFLEFKHPLKYGVLHFFQLNRIKASLIKQWWKTRNLQQLHILYLDHLQPLLFEIRYIL